LGALQRISTHIILVNDRAESGKEILSFETVLHWGTVLIHQNFSFMSAVTSCDGDGGLSTLVAPGQGRAPTVIVGRLVCGPAGQITWQ
jgi:hypothetical protein